MASISCCGICAVPAVADHEEMYDIGVEANVINLQRFKREHIAIHKNVDVGEFIRKNAHLV